MKVLIVDDQVNVINGMIAGVNWEKISVSEVFQACNAKTAKEIIKSQKIDIILCDIEMPGENGLELVAWIKSCQPNIECIFITAYASFAYAKEAIKLGSFDYILQPAKYKDVEQAIIRASQKILLEIELEKYSSYGKMVYTQKDKFIDGILKSYFLGEQVEIKKVLNDLEKMQVYLKQNTVVYCALIQILKLHSWEANVNTELLRYAFNNVLSELFKRYNYNVLIVPLEENNYSMLVYPQGEEPIDTMRMVHTLTYFVEVCQNSIGCSIACYTGEAICMDLLCDRAKQLIRLRQDNVAMQSNVFRLRGQSVEQSIKAQLVDMKNWQQFLIGGNAEYVLRESTQYLDCTDLNLYTLKQFYQEFMHVLAGACDGIGITIYQLFKEKEAFEKSLTAYHSVETLKEMISYVTDYFKIATKKEDANYIELIIQYIHRNIEMDIRRSDLAAMVNLNEDYMSRIFKKEMKVPLKEFIMIEKMKVAQDLLKNTAFPVGTIAIKVGFTNFSHFSKIYKKTMGVTPAEERA